MNSIKIGAIAAILLAGQAMAASTMTYTLEVGGNDQAAAWKNPAGCTNAQAFPVFTAGQQADGKTYNVGDIVTWAARVTVGGTVTLVDPNNAPATAEFPVRGAANMVMSLELRKDSATGALVTVGQGSATTAGFFSAINNGVNNRGTCPALPQDPTRAELAAFPVAWSIDGSNNARVIDGTDFGGPLGGNNATTGSYYQYPTAAGYVSAGGVTATTPSGTLAGMGAGYTNFHFISVVGTATTTEGVGLTAATTPLNCGAVLQDGPAFEGQINTSGLAAGTYYLTLVPGTGNNVLALADNGFGCVDPQDNTNWTGFAKAADTKTGDTITFVLNAPIPQNSTVAGRSIMYFGSAWGTAIVPDKSPIVATGSALTATFANVLTHSRGITGFNIDLANRAGAPAPAAADFEFRSGTSGSSAAWAVVGAAPTVTLLAGAGVGGSDRIQVTFANNAIADPTWLRVKLKSNANGGTQKLLNDDIFYIGSLIGDTGSAGSSASVVSADYNAVYSHRNQAALIDNVWDLDRSKAITSADYNLSYQKRNHVLTFTIQP